MANIDNGFRIEILSLDDKVLIGTGEAQPNLGIGYDGPQGSLYLRQNAGTAGELWLKFGPADVDWQEIKSFPGGVGSLQNSSTGIINGGQLSINGVDATQFDIAAGNGIIVDHETDPLNPTYTLVSWSDIIGTTATNLGISDSSSVTINSVGGVVQYPDATIDNAIHKTEIIIGQMGHVLPATVLNAVRAHPDPVHGPAERLADFSRAIGPINVSGNVYFPNGANLILDKSSGKTHSVGVGFHTNPNDPDVYDDGPQVAAPFFYSYQDGVGSFTGDTTPRTVLTPGLYDDGSGTLATVPAGRWTVQIVHYFTGAEVTRIEYGQQLFSTKEAALDLLPDPDHLSNPTFTVGVIRAFLVLHSAATDLTDPADAIIVEGAKFGSAAGGQFSSSITDLQQAYLNSLDPEIVTEATRGALTITEGAGVGGNLFEGNDETSTLVFAVDTAGNLTSTPINNLNDVTITTPANGEVLTYQAGTWVNAVSAGGGVTDHTLLTNIGVNTHAQIDTHIADGTIHYPQSSISITESQISDLQAYLLNILNEPLDDLSDVILTVPTNGQVLTYNGANWINATPASGVTDHTLLSNIGVNTHVQLDNHLANAAIHFSVIDGLSDVVITTPASGEVLTYDGANWINQPGGAGVAAIDDLNDVTITTVADDDVLQYNTVTGQWENIAINNFFAGIPELIAQGPIPAVTGTAVIPLIATAPLVTEGVPIWTQAITPSTTTAGMKIHTSIAFAVSKASQSFVVALFRDNTCIGTMVDTASGTKTLQTVAFTINDVPGVTTPVTYQVRVGTKASATWWVNSLDTPLLGGTLEANSYVIEEVK